MKLRSQKAFEKYPCAVQAMLRVHFTISSPDELLPSVSIADDKYAYTWSYGRPEFGFVISKEGNLVCEWKINFQIGKVALYAGKNKILVDICELDI